MDYCGASKSKNKPFLIKSLRMVDGIERWQPEQPEDIDQIVSKIVADLSVSKNSSSEIPNGLNLRSFVKDQLGLDHSLQQEALLHLVLSMPFSRIPIPDPLPESFSLSREEEMAIRSQSLGGDNQALESLKPTDKLRTIAQIILEEAGIVQDGTTTSFNVEDIAGDQAKKEGLLNEKPRFISINDQQYFALRLPSTLDDPLFMGILDSPLLFSLKKHVVVADYEKNRDLATAFFNEPTVVRYYVAKIMAEIQLKKYLEMIELLGKRNSEKFKELLGTAEEINWSIKRHFFDLLQKKVGNGQSIVLTDLYRDRDYLNQLDEPHEHRPKLKYNYPETQSGHTDYTVSGNLESNVLHFTWEEKENRYVQGENGADETAIPMKVQRQTDVRLTTDSNGFEYRYTPTSSWTAVRDKVDSLFQPFKIFDAMELVSLNQVNNHWGEIEEEVTALQKIMLQTNTPEKFVQQLAEFEVGKYPTHMFMINTGEKPLITVQDDPPEFPTSIIKNN